MLNNLYVKDSNEKVWTKVVAVFMIDDHPVYIDAYGEQYTIGEADVIDIEKQKDTYLGFDWHTNGLSFKTYKLEYPRGV